MSAHNLTSGFLRLPGGGWGVVVIGHFVHRALPLVAQVGAVPVLGITISSGGDGFAGVLAAAPNAGDELVYSYLPEPAVRTGLRFPAQPVS